MRPPGGKSFDVVCPGYSRCFWIEKHALLLAAQVNEDFGRSLCEA